MAVPRPVRYTYSMPRPIRFARPVLVMNARERIDIVERALVSVRGHVDGAFISVTPGDPLGGELVRLLKRLDIPGHVFAFKRGDGGQMRSDLFHYAELHAAQFGTTHWLNVDADDEIQATGGTLAESIDAAGDEPVWEFREVEVASGHEWRFPRVFRAGLGWRWRYPLHEIPFCRAAPLDPYTPPPLLEGFTYIRHTDTHSGPERFAEHARRIEAWQALPGNAYDARMRFYKGVSWHAAGEYARAIDAFGEHIALGLTCESSWYSRYSIGRCLESLDDTVAAIGAHIDAATMRPTRAEPMVALVRLYRARGDHHAALEWSKLAASLRLPVGDACFIERDVYAWVARDELAMCLAAVDLGDAAADVWRSVLACPSLPAEQRQRVVECLAALAIAAG